MRWGGDLEVGMRLGSQGGAGCCYSGGQRLSVDGEEAMKTMGLLGLPGTPVTNCSRQEGTGTAEALVDLGGDGAGYTRSHRIC